jgi:glycine oxidase
MTTGTSRESWTDVIVVGDGVIGLSVAHQFGVRGLTCRVVGVERAGSASGAAAGLLAPSIGRLSNAVRPFFYASLSRFPMFVDTLRQFDSDLRMLEGLIELTETIEERYVPADARARQLTPSELFTLEPALDSASQAVFHPLDGAIDNIRLLAALRAAVGAQTGIAVEDGTVVGVSLGATRNDVRTSSGESWSAKSIVLAAGAWAPQIDGLPRPLPVSPLKGQMIALRGSPLRHPIMTPTVYLVPRGTETAVGATTERAGFDLATTSRAIAELRAGAVQACPELAQAPLDRAWAGLRPATPDMLPILGPDPEHPALLYACGHSKNGILLAPATAEYLVAHVTGDQTGLDGSPFSIARFL